MTRWRPAPHVLAGLIALAATPASADMMSACRPQIQQFCSDVPKGRGRIAACLYANSGSFSGTCADEVSAVSSSRATSRFVPASVTDLKGTDYEGQLRAACLSGAARLCAGKSTEDDRVLACLYARGNALSKTCKDTSQRVLKEIR